MAETCRIPLGPRGEYEAIVDAEDYAWLSQWRWSFKRSAWQFGGKIYARRNTRAGGRQGTVYMHIAILERSGGHRPSPEHDEGDHRDRNSLNNTRDNLRWATRQEQEANKGPRITRSQKVAYAVASYAAGGALEDIPF